MIDKRSRVDGSGLNDYQIYPDTTDDEDLFGIRKKGNEHDQKVPNRTLLPYFIVTSKTDSLNEFPKLAH